MKLCAALLLLASLAYADNVSNTAYGYIKNYGIPLAEKIRQQEAARIVGGVPAILGQYPAFAGLLGDVIGINGLSVCGASLISPARVVTAAHCWNDGSNQIWRFTVVLGSTSLFSGGTRLETSVVAVHPDWSTFLVRNDIAVVYLPSSVSYSNVIAPISLPTGSSLSTNTIAVGFGVTVDNDSGTGLGQTLNHVSLNVISNSLCTIAYPLFITNDNICTSGIGGSNICYGDSGGPLISIENNEQLLIGISSFVSGLGCSSHLPGVYSRVTSYLGFINQHIG